MKIPTISRISFLELDAKRLLVTEGFKYAITSNDGNCVHDSALDSAPDNNPSLVRMCDTNPGVDLAR